MTVKGFTKLLVLWIVVCCWAFMAAFGGVEWVKNTFFLCTCVSFIGAVLVAIAADSEADMREKVVPKITHLKQKVVEARAKRVSAFNTICSFSVAFAMAALGNWIQMFMWMVVCLCMAGAPILAADTIKKVRLETGAKEEDI